MGLQESQVHFIGQCQEPTSQRLRSPFAGAFTLVLLGGNSTDKTVEGRTFQNGPVCWRIKLLARSTEIYNPRKDFVNTYRTSLERKKKKNQDCTVKEEFPLSILRISLEWSCTKRVGELVENARGLVRH